MSKRLTIITEIISPYRIPLFNALTRREDVDLHVVFLAETDAALREWKVYKEEIQFSYEVLPSWRVRIAGYSLLLNRKVGQAMASARPEVILCGGYNYVASWRALAWARRRGVPFFLWSESNLHDMRPGRAWIEWCKRRFLARCSGFVVPGREAKEYLLSLGMKESGIFVAVNAVDNNLFAAAAKSARVRAGELREDLRLPLRYFLFVGRLVPEKGVFELLSAYAKLNGALREQIGLVFAGDGISHEALEKQSKSIAPGTIRFTGFAQREQLAKFYALAEVLVLPTYTDTWGLVVNEAMASGLPIILSEAAGCAADLVLEGKNGQIIAPRDVASLSAAMERFAIDKELGREMGIESCRRIGEYSPENWAEGIVSMVGHAGGHHD